MRRRLKRPIFLLALCLAGVLLLCFLTYCTGSAGKGAPVKAIPNSPLYPLVAESDKFVRYRPVDYAKPIAHVPIPQHPFMAANAGDNMHNDAYMSDTYEASGPRGLNLRVSSRTQGFGGYGTVAFDRAGRLVGVYSNGRGFRLELLDPFTLQDLADAYELPARPWYFPLQGVMPWEYIGAGMYFYLDHQDRAVVPTTTNKIQIVQVPALHTDAKFKLVREYDLSAQVVPLAWPKEDSLAWALPDWNGKYYWYATTAGMIGTVNADSGAVHAKQLSGEIVENSFAVGEEGVFIISDRAMYRFSLDEDGNIKMDWRAEYDRGSLKKPGVITRGSGTSVTLMGGLDGMVAITDNAEPQIHVLFLKRADGQVVCAAPLFQPGQSATDITVIGFEQADAAGQGTGTYSTIVENNWGHPTFPFSNLAPGITRVDLKRWVDGTYTCKEIWTSAEKNFGVFKLSLGNGLLYTYFKDDSFPNTKWYLTAIDFATGETVYKKLAGTGIGYNNWAGALFLHPQGGIAYSTTIFGLVMIRDR